jgi:hypothetical protein
VSNYKYSPWHITKSIYQSYDWEAYFQMRMDKLNRIKERVENSYGYLRQMEKERLIAFKQEIEEENARWDSALPVICEFFDSDIDDVRTFISARSSIFTIPVEEIKPKLQKLLNWINNPMLMKQIISTSELVGGIWSFNKDQDLNIQFDEIKSFLRIDSAEFFELSKVDFTYFRSVFSDNQYLKKRISKLAVTINLSVDEFINILHTHPYLIHVKPNKVKFNLEWMEKCFNCERIDLVRLMHEYPPIMYWYVSSLGNIFRSCGYSFSIQNKNINTLRKVAVTFFGNGLC